MIKVPSWKQAQAAIERGDANPLELFVYDNEPVGRGAERAFRKQLNAMIGFVCALAVNKLDELKR